MQNKYLTDNKDQFKDRVAVITGSIVDFDQSVLGWHSYSAYDFDELSDSLIVD